VPLGRISERTECEMASMRSEREASMRSSRSDVPAATERKERCERQVVALASLSSLGLTCSTSSLSNLTEEGLASPASAEQDVGGLPVDNANEEDARDAAQQGRRGGIMAERGSKIRGIRQANMFAKAFCHPVVGFGCVALAAAITLVAAVGNAYQIDYDASPPPPPMVLASAAAAPPSAPVI
jgi:hypothetical protein